MTDHTIIITIDGGVSSIHWSTVPDDLHPGDTVRIQIRDFDVEGLDTLDLPVDDHGQPYCGEDTGTIPVLP